MTYSACDSAPIPAWLADYHEYLARASRVSHWPHQSRRPNPPQQAPEVEEPLSGATAQAAIQQRYQPTIERQSNDTNLD